MLLTIVAAWLAKWLDIYGGVLMVWTLGPTDTESKRTQSNKNGIQRMQMVTKYYTGIYKPVNSRILRLNEVERRGRVSDLTNFLRHLELFIGSIAGLFSCMPPLQWTLILPIFDTLDVSPLLSFAVLGCLRATLNSNRVSY